MKSACVGVLSITELENARWNIEILFRVCPSLIHFPPASCAADTNSVCSDFHITQEPNPYPHYQMSAVDNAERQEREVWMVSGIYDDTLLKRH